MTTPNQINPPRNSQRQRGAAILIMTLILMLGLITLFTFRMDRKAPELEADRKTAMALVQAKEALLGNSATNGIATATTENPGRLPCPDLDNDGDSEGAVCASYVGRLPWKTLGMDDLRDGSNEGLWYVLDAGFFDNGTPMNSAAISTIPPYNPALDVNGNKVVAVIIAPGPPLGGLNQQRDTANQNNRTNYLESYGSPTTINLNPSSPNYNDRIISITAGELFNVVTQRMVREFVKKLAENGLDSPYYPSTYPIMARRTVISPPGVPLKPSDTWFDNQWDATVSYSPTPSSNPTQFTLLFTSCTSAFTVVRNAGSNSISGKCQ